MLWFFRFSLDHILKLYEDCSLENAWSIHSRPAFCAAFITEHLKGNLNTYTYFRTRSSSTNFTKTHFADYGVPIWYVVVLPDWLWEWYRWKTSMSNSKKSICEIDVSKHTTVCLQIYCSVWNVSKSVGALWLICEWEWILIRLKCEGECSDWYMSVTGEMSWIETKKRQSKFPENNFNRDD